MTRALAEHLKDNDQRLLGAALAGKAADALGREAGIEAQTLAAWQAQWRRGEGQLTSRDVLVIDEASMVDVRTMAAVLAEVNRADARLVLIGDPHQLQAIGAGDAFRALLERNHAVTLETVHRQRHAWQADASRQAATGNLGAALRAYHECDAIHIADKIDGARAAMARRFLAQHGDQPEKAVLLATRRKDVHALNRAVHEAQRKSGALGPGLRFRKREFSVGDRIILGANDLDGKRIKVLEGEAGLRNGALGTVTVIRNRKLEVRLDDGRRIEIDPKVYHRIDHGYATTIHKAQGITVDHALVLAHRATDRAAAYVALTRHRESLEIHASRDQFPSFEAFVRAMSRNCKKTLVLDFVDEDQARTLAVGQAHQRTTESIEPAALNKRVRLPALKSALARLETREKGDRIDARLERRIAELAQIQDDPQRQRRVETLRVRQQHVRGLLSGIDSSEQIRFEIGILAAQMPNHEIQTLPEQHRAAVMSLREEQRHFLRSLESKLAALRAGTLSKNEQGRLHRSIILLASAVSRHTIYRLTPRSLRKLIRVGNLARNPAAALFHLAPPHLRPLIYGAALARQLVRSISRSR